MKKLLVLLMACVMLFAFAACGGNGNEEETTTNPEVTTEAPANGESDVTEEAIEGEAATEEASEAVTDEDGEAVTDKDGDVVTEKAEETTAKKDNTTKAEKTTVKQASSVPQSKSEIIDYCSKALNKVKSENAGYTKRAVMQVKGDVAGLPKWLVSIFQNDKTTTMKKGAGNKDDFPAAGFDWSCKLRPQDVASATINVSGTTYDIMIKLGTEKNPAKGTASSYGRAVSVIDAAGAAGMVPGLNSVDMTYHDGYIHAKIDSTTGKITFVEFSAAADAKANVALIGDVQAKDITSTETYTNFVW